MSKESGLDERGPDVMEASDTQDAEVASDTVEVKAVKPRGFEAGTMVEVVEEEGATEEGAAEEEVAEEEATEAEVAEAEVAEEEAAEEAGVEDVSGEVPGDILFEDGDDVAEADILFMDPDLTVADTALSDAHAQIEGLEAALAAKEAEFKTLNSRMLRMAADYDNFRKRSQREKEDLRRFSTEGVLKDLLPVIDNLELAMRHAGEEAKGGLAQGVGMVLRQFQQQLGKYGVVGFESMHKPFNPELHEAVQQRDNDEHPHETVIDVFQRGYHIHERLLRPAMVVVANNPNYTAADDGDAEVEEGVVEEGVVDAAASAEGVVDEAVVEDGEQSAEGEDAQAEREASES